MSKSPTLAEIRASLEALETRKKSERSARRERAKGKDKKPRVIPPESREKLREAGKRGAIQRAKTLTPELRSQIAREAARGKHPPP